jgi:hypothetical protein
MTVRQAEFANAAPAGNVSNQRLAAHEINLQHRAPVFYLLIECQVNRCGLVNVGSNHSVNHEFCISIVNAYGYALAVRDDGEDSCLAESACFTQISVNFCFCKADFLTILRSAVDYRHLAELDRLCPEYFTAPSGRRFPIDYSTEQPTLSLMIKELYGVDTHPAVGRNRMPLRLELLSPARRPVQITGDLPGFWRGSWALVRSEMRSRYPKHNWERTAPPVGKK